MRPVVASLIFAATAAVAGLLYCLVLLAPATPRPLVTVVNRPYPEPAVPAIPADIHLVGSASCAAGACHGSPPDSLATSNPAWRSSYAIWAASDPHSHAFETLFGSCSQGIVNLLEPISKNDDSIYRQVLERRCLSCHATVEPLRQASELVAIEGVSCESCHGAAARWLERHATKSWADIPPNEKYGPTWGMTNLNDLTERATTCAGCHVGSPDIDGRPWRDVNHDLIAAGHPRLNFEFRAYLAALPAHWDVAKDRACPDFEVQTWTIGQLVSARAALKQLKSRTHAARAPTKDSAALPVWPEFAEYDCYSCHHGLQSTGFRQERILETPGDLALGSAALRRPGALAWGTWHFSTSFLLAAPSSSKDEAWLNTVRLEMTRPLPNAERIETQVTTALRQLESQLDDARRGPLCLPELLLSLSKSPSKFQSWDEVTQWYLAVDALHGACLGQCAEEETSRSDLDLLGAALGNFRAVLEFNSAVQADALSGHAPSSVNSPANFDPGNKDVAQQIARLRRLVAALAASFQSR